MNQVLCALCAGLNRVNGGDGNSHVCDVSLDSLSCGGDPQAGRLLDGTEIRKKVLIT